MSRIFCEECHTPDGTTFSVVPGKPGLYCDLCIGKKPIKIITNTKQHLPIFTKWHCRTHNCGAYSMNALCRNEWDACDIEYENTVGVIRPKTYGGYNGDLGRHHFAEWQEELQRKDKRKHAIANWNKYSKSKQRPARKKYAYKSKRLQ